MSIKLCLLSINYSAKMLLALLSETSYAVMHVVYHMRFTFNPIVWLF